MATPTKHPLAPAAVSAVTDASEWLPYPLLEWAQLAVLVAPGKPASRARVRTLRDKNRVSRGVKVTHRAGSGVAGASSYYSVLSLWAERARDRGFGDDAERLTASAMQVENEFGLPLQEFLARHTLRELPDAAFFWTLADKTARVLAESETWADCVVAVASITEMDAHFAHLEGRSMQGAPRSVDLPRHVVDSSGLGTGSFVFVLSRSLGAGAFVEVDPAVPSRENWEAGVRSGYFANPAMTPPADEPEGGWGWRDYGAGPGAPLTPALAARSWTSLRDAGMKPTPLRPAG